MLLRSLRLMFINSHKTGQSAHLTSTLMQNKFSFSKHNIESLETPVRRVQLKNLVVISKKQSDHMPSYSN